MPYLFALLFALPLAALAHPNAPPDTLRHSPLPTVDGSNGRCLPTPMADVFPVTEWCGTPVIGMPDETADYPLQKALGLAGKRLKVYGWVSGGANLSSSHDSNAPMAYNIVPNRPVLDQFILRFERQPNTVQTDHADWGFLVDNLYGTNYRYTIAKGIVSDRLLESNHLYGYDPTQVYAVLYLPKIAQGVVLKAGRFISPADIEAQWAPENFLYSHSLMFVVDPYTFSGAQATIRLNAYWQVELGLHGGSDVALWTHAAQPNGLAMVRWVARNNNNSLYGGINAIGIGQYASQHDNLQVAVATWGHRFSKTVNTMTEAYYMWEHNALLGGTVINGPPHRFYPDTGPGPLLPGLSYAIGVLNFLQIGLSDNDYLSLRNELFLDPRGFRTANPTPYSTHTLGVSHSFTNLVRIRPEVRYERAYAAGVTPYDNDQRRDQYTAAMDVIVRF